MEGSTDALAVLAHAWASGVEQRVAPICMPTASANFTETILEFLQGKGARIFIDDDEPGEEAAQRWATQLKNAGIPVDGFLFSGLSMTDGRKVKDLNDLLRIDYDSWEQHRAQIESVMNFSL